MGGRTGPRTTHNGMQTTSLRTGQGAHQILPGDEPEPATGVDEARAVGTARPNSRAPAAASLVSLFTISHFTSFPVKIIVERE